MDEIGPIKKTSLAEQIAGHLRRMILSGAFMPGERLPSERELALRFGTNRNTDGGGARFIVSLPETSDMDRGT